MNEIKPSRRRFIGIIAAGAGLAALPGAVQTAWAIPGPKPQAVIWRGIALGADAELHIYHSDPLTAQRLIEQAVAEMHRLEKIFSLYRPDSALSILNRQGYLNTPPADLLVLLGLSKRFSDITDGAFDPTVQSLWRIYAEHFSQPGAHPDGPDAVALKKAVTLVNYKLLHADEKQIRLLRPGMGVTLNGIAQGYITDQVTQLLRKAGLDRALIDMGEVRGLNAHAAGSGTPWRVGLADPDYPEQIFETLDINNEAVSTSGGYGTLMDVAGRHTHIFNPKTGLSQPRYRSVSVMAPQASTADALSTAFSVMPLAATNQIVRELGLKAWFILPDGSRLMQGDA